MSETLRTSGRGVAFFDVDETLVATKTMASFLNYHRTGRVSITSLAGPWDEFIADLPPGISRAEVNRRYYELWCGVPVSEVRRAAERWWAEVVGLPGAFVAEGVQALREHRRAGDLVVLVSGSFGPVLAPVAAHLGADAVICTVLREVDGVFSGAIVEPMIGENKARAATEFLEEHSIPRTSSWAYGDHESDIPMLEVAAHPRVVGGDPHLLQHALRRGWR